MNLAAIRSAVRQVSRPHPGRSVLRRSETVRTAVVCCLVLLTALCGACSGGGRDTVVVLGPWTGPEGSAFEDTLKQLDHGSGVVYSYEGTTSLRETLVAQIAAGSPPDVAILNSVGELTEYADSGRLKPIDPGTARHATLPWAPALRVNGVTNTYWVPLKVDLKSLVWSRRNTPAGPQPWCIGMASQATSGWPGTDWIEDILLHQAGPEVYEQWAAGRVKWTDDTVSKAWTTWGSLLGRFDDEAITRSLAMSYDGTPDPTGGDIPRGLLNTLPCVREHQSGFIGFHYSAADVGVEPSAPYLSGQPEYRDTYEVSGDMAAVFSDSPAAQRLVGQLTTAARKPWQDKAVRSPKPLFPGAGAPVPDDPLDRRIAAFMSEPSATLCFDASDMMPPALRDAFHRAVLIYFKNHSKGELRLLLDQLQTVSEHAHASSAGRTGEDGAAVRPGDICAGPPGAAGGPS